MADTYKLLIGSAPDGGAVHPVDEVGTYPDLAAAKAAAGDGLVWTWAPQLAAWQARTGPGEIAEIIPGTRIAGITVVAETMS